jgi:hypothetical protein
MSVNTIYDSVTEDPGEAFYFPQSGKLFKKPSKVSQYRKEAYDQAGAEAEAITLSTFAYNSPSAGAWKRIVATAERIGASPKWRVRVTEEITYPWVQVSP